MTRDRETARRIAQEVRPLGGSVYYVGGCVRDRLLGRESKDLDIEVHGVTPQQLEAVLDRMGGRRTVGASFGVYGLAGCGLDIAMPRREAAVGRGHRDFTVEVDPWLGPERAARRRDFTVNALMEDVLTGQVLDFFGGREDLRRGLLRHVDDHSFPEDPLRVLRGAQFAARFGFTVAKETVALCRTMDLSALSRERVEGELQRPSCRRPALPSSSAHWIPCTSCARGSRRCSAYRASPSRPATTGRGMCGSTPWRCWIPPPSCGPKQPSPWP